MSRTSNPRKFFIGRGWRVKIAGRQYRLGGDESKAEAKRRSLVAAWLTNGVLPEAAGASSPRSSNLTVAAALAEYLERGVRASLSHCQRDRITRACQEAIDRCGGVMAATFGSLELKRLRSALLARPAKCKRNHAAKPNARLSRPYVNSLIGCIKTAWRWLASEELVPAWREHELRTVRALGEGDGGEECPSVLPPPAGNINAALEHLTGPPRAMVMLQRLTGMRPGEICGMRRADLSISSNEILQPPNALPTSAFLSGDVLVWVFAPSRHKTKRKGKPRLIALGPKSQALLLPFVLRGPWLEPPMGDYLFRPADRPKGAKPNARAHYSVGSYANAIRRACMRAGVPPWQPNQLRHAVATELFADDPLTAMSTLGHSSMAMTAYYSAANLRRAGEHAAKAG